LSSRYLLSPAHSSDEEFCIEGVIILDDLETCINIKGTSVIVFDNSAKSNESIKKLESGGDVQIAFDSALAGNAEEISLERLVRFYLDNA
jgi:hypothetical protein